MRYVIIAVVIYLLYLVIRSFLSRKAGAPPKEQTKKRSYDVNRIQDAEFREVKKD
jgi:hypothetical protein